MYKGLRTFPEATESMRRKVLNPLYMKKGLRTFRLIDSVASGKVLNPLYMKKGITNFPGGYRIDETQPLRHRCIYPPHSARRHPGLCIARPGCRRAECGG